MTSRNPNWLVLKCEGYRALRRCRHFGMKLQCKSTFICEIDKIKYFTNDVIRGRAASSHMSRLSASGLSHEEMLAYRAGPAAVSLHCSVRCNCSTQTHSCLFTGLQLQSSCQSVLLVLIDLTPCSRSHTTSLWSDAACPQKLKECI